MEQKSNPPINVGDLEIFQLGYVYKDIKKQAALMEKMWGMPKFAFLGENTNEVIYRGVNSSYTTSICFTRYWGKQIELIQYVSGEGIHKEFIDQGKEGFHHISCIVDDVDKYIKQFEENGVEAAFIGKIGKQYFAYFDTVDSLGFFLELQTTLKRSRKK